MIFHRELAMIYESRGRNIVEFIIKLNEDRPGILAAISDVFAENGANIINVSFNRLQKMIHVVADFTEATGSINDVENMIKKFSFVNDITEYVLVGEPYVVASLSIPTFSNNNIVAIDHDIIEKVRESECLSKLMFEVGLKDGKMLRELYGTFKNPLLWIIQLRGLGRVSIEVGGHVVVKVCRENMSKEYSAVVKSYIEGLLNAFGMKIEEEHYEGACASFRLSQGQ